MSAGTKIEHMLYEGLHLCRCAQFSFLNVVKLTKSLNTIIYLLFLLNFFATRYFTNFLVFFRLMQQRLINRLCYFHSTQRCVRQIEHRSIHKKGGGLKSLIMLKKNTEKGSFAQCLVEKVRILQNAALKQPKLFSIKKYRKVNLQ